VSEPSPVVPETPVVVLAVTLAADHAAQGVITGPGGARTVTADTEQRLVAGMLAETVQLARRLERPVRVRFVHATEALRAVHPDGSTELIGADGVLGDPAERTRLRSACREVSCGADVPVGVNFCPRCGAHHPHLLQTAAPVIPAIPEPAAPAAGPEWNLPPQPTAAASDLPAVTVDEHTFDLLTATTPRTPAVPLLAAHPGCGVTTWAALLDEPEVDDVPAGDVAAVVCRSTPSGIDAAKAVIGRIGVSRVVTVLVIADAPGRMIPAAARELKVLAGAVSITRVPWISKLRGARPADLNSLAGPLTRPLARVRAAVDGARRISSQKETA